MVDYIHTIWIYSGQIQSLLYIPPGPIIGNYNGVRILCTEIVFELSFANASNVHSDTKLEYLHSDFFKFILKSPNARSPVKSMASSEAGLSSIAEPVFHIHRDLLASLSPEFRKHTNNEMKEGREHTMELHDVSEKTIKTFIGWAYTGDYITFVGPLLAYYASLTYSC